MKRFLYTIIFSFILCNTVFANSKVAVVGHSQAAHFAWYNKIDIASDSCVHITNNAVGGDGLYSYGLPCDVNGTLLDGTIVKYKKGYGKGRIAEFPKKANEYDYLFLLIGDTEFTPDMAYLGGFLNRLDKYLYEIRNNAPTLNIITFPLVARTGNKEMKDIWNSAIKEVYEKYNCFTEEWPARMTFEDSAHFSAASLIELYNKLKVKYNIT